MQKAYILFVILAVGCTKPVAATAQPAVYKFEQIDSLQRVEKRNIMVFIHTDWCKFCRTMEYTTFKNKDVVNALNRQFYFVSLDAEQKQDISFNGKTFKYKPSGAGTGIHELAVELGTIDGQVSYPGICILNPKYEIVFSYNQFLSAGDLLLVLQRVLDRSKQPVR